MTSRGNTLLGAALAASAVVLLSGCGPSTGGEAKPATPTSTGPSLAADVPRNYDPCKDVPQSVLDSEKLHNQHPVDDDTSSGVRWVGCQWVRSNGYGVSIRTTNLTIDLIRSRNFAEASEFTIGGRRAISTRQFEGEFIKYVCTVNVEMKGGSLDINLNNPPSGRDTGSIDSCVLARGLAEQVVPSLPPAS
ncbi:DUF3558 domain-containing protein [Nocardia sp. NBC_01009]|uniref:DUF3558 domain-containing protein n=1 Tax=Nocardia sp. NBC_01009 TaxID=2975996 RepID=UPI0038667133|nr:DUF3558 domain-containing protein [Nocardia sp. NBC_01009]